MIFVLYFKNINYYHKIMILELLLLFLFFGIYFLFIIIINKNKNKKVKNLLRTENMDSNYLIINNQHKN